MTYEQAQELFYSNEEIMKQEFDFHKIDNAFANMETIISDIEDIAKERGL